MTDAVAADEEPVPHIRNQAFVDWIERVTARIQDAEDLTREQIAGRGGMSRQQYNRWRGIGGPQSIPEPESLIAFCVGNKLDLVEPYRILGWGEPPRLSSADRHTEAALVAVAEALDDDALDEADRAEVLAQLDFLVDQLRARAQRRRGDGNASQ